MANSTQDSRVTAPGRGRVADHRRHGSGNRAHGGGPPGALLHGRVEEQIAGQGEGADQAGEQVHAQPQFDETGHRKRDAEGQRARRRRDRAGGQRAVRGAPHLAIGLALVPLVERGGAGGDQAGADDGVEQRKQRNALEELRPVGRAGQSEEIADPGAHQDQPGDSRLGQFNVIAHQAMATPSVRHRGRHCQYHCRSKSQRTHGHVSHREPDRSRASAGAWRR